MRFKLLKARCSCKFHDGLQAHCTPTSWPWSGLQLCWFEHVAQLSKPPSQAQTKPGSLQAVVSSGEPVLQHCSGFTGFCGTTQRNIRSAWRHDRCEGLIYGASLPKSL